jgi:LacI family transcriptional regulator, repressor for deo operon, udp, cdd, tsx, nupC, and nupG
MLQGGFTIASSRRSMNALLDSHGPRPTGVFAGSDEMAIGAILAITDHGLSVPGDISVIGIDNHDLAESFCLTTVAQDPFEQGSLGARMMLDELAGKPARATSVRAAVELIERSSTAPPPA